MGRAAAPHRSAPRDCWPDCHFSVPWIGDLIYETGFASHAATQNTTRTFPDRMFSGCISRRHVCRPPCRGGASATRPRDQRAFHSVGRPRGPQQQPVAQGRAGELGSPEVAESEAARILEARRDIERRLIEEQSLLNVLMNRSPQAPLGRPPEVAMRHFDFPLERLQAMALEHRPEIVSARKKIEAAKARRTL